MAVLYFILLIVSLLFYILYEGVFSFYLFSFMLLLPGFVQAVQTAGRYDKTGVTVKIENPLRIPVPNCMIKISYYMRLDKKAEYFTVNTPLFPKNVQYLTVSVSSKHYGALKMRIESVRINDMLKLFFRTKKFKNDTSPQLETMVTVFPDYTELENPVMNYSEMGLETDVYSKTKKGDDPSEIFDIHEYVEGDKISRIHWKLTAKQDKTMVKDYSLPVANSVLIAVDLDIPLKNGGADLPDCYDLIMECAASVSMRLLENQCPHRTVWFDPKMQTAEHEMIGDIEDYTLMISRLLETPLGGESIVYRLAAEDERVKYGHILIITASLDEKKSAVLPQINSAPRITVLSADKNADMPFEIDERCSVVPVQTGAIAECMQDIYL